MVNDVPRRARGLRQQQPAMSEAAFMLQVTGLAQLLGWHWFHARPAQTAHGWRTAVSGPLGRGFPDLVMARPRDRRLIFAELKRDGGRTTPEQDAVLEVLRAVAGESVDVFTTRVEVCVWRPADFDQIAEILR